MSDATIFGVSTNSRCSARAVRFLAPHSALIACALFMLVGALVLDDYGISWDEPVQRHIAITTADYISGDDDALLRPKDRGYGVAIELPLLFIERLLGLEDSRSIYLSRHLLTHLFFLVAGVFSYLLVYRLFNNRLLALFALLLFLLHPRMYAHSFFNSKDIPFLSMFMIALFLIHRAFKKDTFAAFLLCGVGVGLLTNIRILGVMLFAAPLAMRVFDLIHASGGWAERRHVLLTAGLFALASAFTVYATWPYLWSDPIGHFVEAFTLMVHYPNNSFSLFQGKLFHGTNLPPHYIPTWFTITTPPVVVLLGVVGIVSVFRQAIARPRDVLCNTSLRFGFLLIACFTLPVLAVVLLRSTLYDGWRQMYFLYAPFCVLALFGLHWLVSLVKRDILRRGMYVLVGMSVAATVFSMIGIHPYQSVYFNFLVDRATPGYLRTQYNMEYWGVSYREALEYLVERYPSSQISVDSDFNHARRNLLILPKEVRERIVTPAADEADFHVTNHRMEVFTGVTIEDNRCHLRTEPVYTRELYGSTILSVISIDRRSCLKIYRQVVSGEPIARDFFDLYHNAGENTLTYIKKPCSRADTEAGIFLHIVPADAQDLPDRRKRYGFDNYDFGFNQSGAHFDGKCVATVNLPEYPIARIRTGQYISGEGQLWKAEFSFPGNR